MRHHQRLGNEKPIVSFRDPDGYVVQSLEGPLQRFLTAEGSDRSQIISRLRTIKSLQADHRWVRAENVAGDAPYLLHPRIFFPTYPSEWPATMLHRAAQLTLQITQSLLGEGWELKDATPTNILFEGTRPVFVDYLSPINRKPEALGWCAYGQFIRTFLIPLLLHKKCHIPLKWLYSCHRDGIYPDLALKLLGPYKKFHPLALELVTLPSWLGKRSNASKASKSSRITSDIATKTSLSLLKRLGQHLGELAPAPPKHSHWYDYQDFGVSYTSEGLAEKDTFIQESLATCQPTTVLDLGCNTGKFSKMAATAGARVVALDSDPECVERLFIECDGLGLDVQPLVIDFGRPTPGLGWNYNEEFSLLDRLHRRFGLTFALAIAHHLLVRERIPLEEIVRFIANTTIRYAVIEWVPPEDPQFQSLSGVNHHLYDHIGVDTFTTALSPWFRILSKKQITGCARTLFLLERWPLPPSR